VESWLVSAVPVAVRRAVCYSSLPKPFSRAFGSHWPSWTLSYSVYWSFECELEHIIVVWNCLCIWSCDLKEWDILMHYPVCCAVEHPHHTLPVILALANSYRDQEFTDGTKNQRKSEVGYMSQSYDWTQI
jgi:hypothetical protein